MLIPVNDWCGRRDSNSHALRHWYLKPACLPIPPLPLTVLQRSTQHTSYNHRAFKLKYPIWLYGVDNGARTHDRRNHNPELYQLSYAHHKTFFLRTCTQVLQESQHNTKICNEINSDLTQDPTSIESLTIMAHPAGFEPATIRLEGGCSIQLSYGRSVL